MNRNDTHERQQADRRKARKFARAAKSAQFWRDAPFAIRERPRPSVQGGAR
jgi:hypothetical protein